MKWNGRQYRPANAQFITKKKPFDFQEALKPYGEKELPVWSPIVAVNNETTSVPDVTPTPTGTPAVTPTNTPTPSITPSPTPQVQWNAEGGYYAGYSLNSNNWFEIGYPVEGYLTFSTLASNGTRWAATGTLETGFLSRTFYSDNGSTWITGNNSPYTFMNSVVDLTSNGDKFILAGSSSYSQILSGGSWTTVGYSNDGITYSAGTITVQSGRALPSSINSTAFNGDMWIGGGTSTGTTGNRTVLIYSYDGINWSGQTNTLWTGTTIIRSVAYGNGRWVATSNIGGNGRIAVSYDGFNWSASTNASNSTIFGTSTSSGYINHVIWFNDKFIATANASGATTHTVCYSYDGFNWSAATSTKSLISGVLNIASNKSDFVMIGATPGGAVYQSPDGINWSANTTDQSVVFNNTAIGRISNKQPEQQSPNPSQTPSQTPSNTPTTTLTSTPTPTTTLTSTPTPTTTLTSTPTPTTTLTSTPTPSITPSPSVPASGTTEANTYLEAVVQAGGTGVTSTVSAATRTLFTSLVSNNLWDKVITMYPMIGGTSASHAVMGKTTGVKTITWNGGVTHGVSGATGNGVNGYGDTNFNLVSTSGYAQNDLSYGIYVTVDGGGANVYDFGVHGSTALDDRPYDLAARRSGTGQALFDAGGTAYNTRISYTTSTGRGFLFGVRRASNDRELYKNGTSVGTSSVNDDTNITSLNSPYILAQNPGGGGTVYYSDNTIGFVITGKAFSDSEASTLSTIINTFMTSLGRNAY